MNTLELFLPGVEVWISDEEDGWVLKSLSSKNISSDGKSVRLVFTESNFANNIMVSRTPKSVKSSLPRVKDDGCYELEFNLQQLEDQKYSQLPLLRNPSVLDGIDDLTNLNYLHEPGVLQSLKYRYSRKIIYTYSGIVLIAVNPFEKLQLYGSELVKAYSGKRKGELEPHLFAIAEDAYRCMKVDGVNQSIIVSGESGSGKTVSAKYIMRYFATVDRIESLDEQSDAINGAVEEQVIATNPLMEAFGNAKTTRNDNSSRFGKFIEINFNQRNEIIGATMRTYLLERSRVIFQSETERNYHIFYQLCAGARAAEKRELYLLQASEFRYLQQGNCTTINGVDDAKDFEQTQRAMSIIGIPVQIQWKIFRLIAAILHIGNIDIRKSDQDPNEASTINVGDTALCHTAELLGVEAEDLANCIIQRKIITRAESIISSNNVSQANQSRHSLAKYIYINLFDHLVYEVNKSLTLDNDKLKENLRFIAVLDIYGFEHFQKNSFEQFCINYANEKLQQEFNRHVFKLEQELYVKEEITWSFIDFNDNQNCIELIEGKLGVIDLLDEECRMPSGNDNSFATKILKQNRDPKVSKYFAKPRFGSSSFIINHFAYNVAYEVDGFVDKNKDTVSEEQLQLLQSSSFDFCKQLFGDKTSEISGTGGKKKGKQTLGSSFKSSLNKLMETIHSTNVHYIRCIKPNESKVPDSFDNVYILQQLRACGILETVRISCAGYPSRWEFSEFLERYKVLLKSKDLGEVNDPRNLARCILERAKFSSDKYQIGISKIFFRAGQLAYLDKMRLDVMNKSATMIQKTFRAYSHRKRYLAIVQFLKLLQTCCRKFLRVGEYTVFRRNTAATLIQNSCRKFLCINQKLSLHRTIIGIQTRIRYRIANERAMEARRLKFIVSIQSQIRLVIKQNWTRKFNQRVIRIQCLYRKKKARRILVGLRTEARSLNHIKEVKYKLENKVVELTQQLQGFKEMVKSLREENKQLHERLDSKTAECLDLKLKGEKIRKDSFDFEVKIKALNETIVLKDQEIKKLKFSGNGELSKSRETINELQEENKKLKEKFLSVNYDVSNDTAHNSRRHTFSSKPFMQSDANSFISPLNFISAIRKASNASSTEAPSKRLSVEEPPSPIKSNPNTTYSSQEMLDLISDSRVETEILDNFVASTFTNEELIIPKAFPGVGNTLVPSYIISFRYLTLWRLGQVDKSAEFMSNVLKTVECQWSKKMEPDSAVGYWLLNMIQLWIYLIQAKMDGNRPRLSQTNLSLDFDEMEKSIAKNIKKVEDFVKEEIFHKWLKELWKKHEKLALSAILDHQGLPGYTTETGVSTRLFGFRVDGPSTTIEEYLSYLNQMVKAFEFVVMDISLKRLLFLNIFRHVASVCFNQMIMRKNFLSWKRGVQLQYNVTRLQEWCASHSLEEVSLCLEKLAQAAKLLQLSKQTLADVEAIFDVCFLLSPNQIKKIIFLYQREEFEEPITPEVIQAVAKRSLNDQESLMLDTGEFTPLKLESFLKSSYSFPANFHYNLMNLPHVKNMFEAVLHRSKQQ